MSALAWALAAGGVLLLWAAVKGEDPRDILRGVFSGAGSAARKVGRTVPKAA